MKPKQSALDSFKLYFEEVKSNPNNRFKGPGAVSIFIEEAIFAVGRQIKFATIFLGYLGRLGLKRALLSISIMLFMLYNRI